MQLANILLLSLDIFLHFISKPISAYQKENCVEISRILSVGQANFNAEEYPCLAFIVILQFLS